MTTTRPCAAVTSFLLLLLLSSAAVSLAAKTAGQQAPATSVYVVMVKPPGKGVNYKTYQIGILATALGSEEKAKQALLYHYNTVASGFAARLTQPQLAALKKHPAFVNALPETRYSLQDEKNLN